MPSTDTVPSRVELVTFTGVDAATDPDDLERLWSRYPAVEFAVLVGGINRNRHQPPETLDGWRSFMASTGTPMAVHLCGPYARNTHTGMSSPATEMCAGFSRVQVNSAGYDYLQMAAFADTVDAGKVILQHRGPFRGFGLIQHPKIEYLFDRSGGRGRACFDHWPEPPDPPQRVGYAGGIGPHNIGAALAAVDRFAAGRVWLDMETGVRTDDRFDPSKAEAVCQAVFDS